VSTRTFFRYFASKNDLMGQGMVRYRALLSDAIHSAPKTVSPLQVVRHTIRQVASVAAAQPRVREIVKIATRSVAAREAQLSRRAEVEDTVAAAFASQCRTGSGDEITLGSHRPDADHPRHHVRTSGQNVTGGDPRDHD
jgi:AcrR family transcriptional regulator